VASRQKTAKKVSRKGKRPKKAVRKKKAVSKKTGRRKAADAAPELLVEIGTEELPPKALLALGQALGRELHGALARAQLLENDQTEYRNFAAPRRLAVRIPGVRRKQPDQDLERRGPAIQAAFDDSGAPTRAAQGFATSCGVTVEQLQRVRTGKGEWLVHRHREPGRTAAALIPELLQHALGRLPIPRHMRWGDLDAEFVRPVHWLVLLHGDRVIPAELLSVHAGRDSRGHRFHHPGRLRVKHARDYEGVLKKSGFVIADFAERRERIRAGVMKLAAKEAGRAHIEEDLLDEVASLVEWPEPILGRFDAEYLDVPHEALVSTMQANQKYFPVVDSKNRLLPCFLTVSNIRSRRKAVVREGNERVLRARFADAQFFWNTDRKQKLESRVAALKDVVFHVRLGSVYDKTERIGRLGGIIAEQLGGARAEAERAAILCKADLLSGMVGEFPELQGIMGRYYALHDGEPKAVAEAIEEHYWPRFAGDLVAPSTAGRALAIADRLDTLTGIFAVGEVPTGEKDPFALRRAALGALRTMIEARLDLDLRALLDEAVQPHQGLPRSRGAAEQVYEFMMERLRAYYADAGVRPDVFESVRVCNPSKPFDFGLRVTAVMAFLKMKEAASLTAANKRIRNILKQGEQLEWDHVSEVLLQEPAEKVLAAKVKALREELAPLFEGGDYTAAMKKLAALRPQVDDFFDRVMVMVDEEAVRDNRLALLSGLSELFLRVADLSKLQD
jgi:glycyl-tRNA synthetase beta chain